MRGIALVAAAAMTAALGATGAAPVTSGFRSLHPGQVANYSETVPIQVVLVGLPAGAVTTSGLRSQLVPSGLLRIRDKLAYQLPGPLGIHYRYTYSFTTASNAYSTAVFAELRHLSRPERAVDGRIRTEYQQMYNNEEHNALTVTRNYEIDGPSVEKYLVEHPPAGVDPKRDTMYLLNWWGHPGFRFHVYTKFGEPDPDTGRDNGRQQSRLLSAWGGTPSSDEETGFGRNSRTWFDDLSAGPDYWTTNWDVDDPDVDGDGYADYRIPPIWEYLLPNGYHPVAHLARDLSYVIRLIGVDQLFTPSPIYPPMMQQPDLPATVNLDVNTYNDPASGLTARQRDVKGAEVLNEERKIAPFRVTMDRQNLPYDAKAKECLQDWIHFSAETPCYPKLPYDAYSDLYLNNALKKHTWRDGGGDYEVGIFDYALPADPTASVIGLTDDDHRDGDQSGIYVFNSPYIRHADNLGFTSPLIHEVGHYFGLSHPHDGYDPGYGVQYGPYAGTYFAWLGDEVNSVMGYLWVNDDFSQFDRDNIDRYWAAGYTTAAQLVAARILASPHAGAAAADLHRADVLVGATQAAFTRHDYPAAVADGRSAWYAVRAGAHASGVTIPQKDPWHVDRSGGSGRSAGRQPRSEGPDTVRGLTP